MFEVEVGSVTRSYEVRVVERTLVAANAVLVVIDR